VQGLTQFGLAAVLLLSQSLSVSILTSDHAIVVNL